MALVARNGSREFKGRKALVTGAGSGIGQATAVALARAGADLVLCDIDATGLAQTEAVVGEYGSAVLARRVDVSSPEQMLALSAEVQAQWGALDILVNNAGVAVAGGFCDTLLSDWERLIGVNLWGVIYGCHFFLPPMIAAGRGGHVINLASAAGFVADMRLAAYSTTKFAVIGLSEALRQELVPHRIGVTAVCPGIVDTAIARTTPLRGNIATGGARERIIKLYQQRGYSPQRVATAILDAIRHDRALVPVTPEAWGLYYLKRLFPRQLPGMRRIAERFLAPDRPDLQAGPSGQT